MSWQGPVAAAAARAAIFVFPSILLAVPVVAVAGLGCQAAPPPVPM